MRTTIIILTTLLLTSISERLFACSCIGQRTVQEEVKHADAIIVGTITKKDILTLTDSVLLQMFPNDTIMKNSPMVKMTIARYGLLVLKVYKGKITTDTVTIYTGLGGGDCGIRFQIGEKYVVYGESNTYYGQVNNDFKFPKGNNVFWSYSCLRTTTYSQDEITEIEKFVEKHNHKTNDTLSFLGADQNAEFVGGKDSLMKFIAANFKYEKQGLCNYPNKVYVEFIIDEYGKFSTLTSLRPSNSKIPLELIRIFNLMPIWKPAVKNGKNIKSKQSISFSLK